MSKHVVTKTEFLNAALSPIRGDVERLLKEAARAGLKVASSERRKPGPASAEPADARENIASVRKKAQALLPAGVVFGTFSFSYDPEDWSFSVRFADDNAAIAFCKENKVSEKFSAAARAKAIPDTSLKPYLSDGDTWGEEPKADDAPEQPVRSRRRTAPTK